MIIESANSTPVKVYDCSLPLPERAWHAREFVSVSKASNFLRISRKVLIRCAKNRGRIYSATLGKEFAIRYKN